MNWFLQFLSAPLRSCLGLLDAVVGAIVLLAALAHSPRGMALLAGILGLLMLLLAVRVLSMRLVLTIAGIAFVVVELYLRRPKTVVERSRVASRRIYLVP